MDALIRDIRHALRLFARHPGFTATTLLVLTLGIGSNTAIFSVVYGVMLKALPYGEPDRIVVVLNGDVDDTFGISDQERLRYRAQTHVFERFGAYVTTPVNLTGGQVAAERVPAAYIDADVLPALAVQPPLGRAFGPDDDVPGNDGVVLLGDALWRRRFAGAADVLGRSLTVDGSPRTIVGVLPADFRLPTAFVGSRADVFLPLAPDPVPDPRNFHYLSGVARLADGVSIESAGREMAALSVRLREDIATLPPTFEARLAPIRESVLGNVRPALLVLLGAVGLVLLIAAVNVANLFLARAEQRRVDTAIRSAIGASRLRLVRQALTESGVLAAAACALGLALGSVVLRALTRLSPPNLPRIDEVGLDLPVFVFTAGISLGSAVLFGLLPTFESGRDPQTVLRVASRSVTRGGGRMRRVLVVGEMALAVMLAIGGALLVQSFARLQAVDAGFAPRGTLTVGVSLPSERYADKEAARAFYRLALDRIGALPGVVAAGGINNLPMSSQPGDWGIRIEGREEERLPSGRRPWADWMVATDGYMEAMGVPIREGRAFGPADTADAPPVVLINETLARLYWPDGTALGKRFTMSSDIDTVYRTIIGIVGDVKHGGKDAEPRRAFYVPHAQFPASQDFPVGDLTLVARTPGDAAGLAASIRQVVATIDADVPLADLRSMDQVIDASMSVRRLNAWLFGAFGLLGVALVAVGVYGVTSYSVASRTRELGVRMAFGASPGRLIRMIVGQGLRLGLVGAVVGMGGSIAFSRWLEGMLFGVSAVDLATVAAVPLGLVVVVLVASYVPAWRATRADPLAALQSD